jgi:hypothetical protein
MLTGLQALLVSELIWQVSRDYLHNLASKMTDSVLKASAYRQNPALILIPSLAFKPFQTIPCKADKQKCAPLQEHRTVDNIFALSAHLTIHD